MSDPAAKLNDAVSFHRGHIQTEDFAPFSYEEPGQGMQTFGEFAPTRIEGSDGTPLVVGVWKIDESTTSPVYTSALGDETFLVLEGEVTIKDLDANEEHTFAKGDFCSWSAGTRTEWTFKAPFKKLVIVAGR